MLHVHVGKTEYDGCLRFHRGTISATIEGEKREQECFFEHPIKWWAGISWGGKWFFGFIRTDGARDVRAERLHD